MKQQEAQKIPLSDFPIFSGTDVESSRQALSRIFNPVFLEPGKDLKSFQFSVHGVQLPHLWLSSLSYMGNPELGPIEPSNYHTLQVIPSGNIRFDIDGRKIKANAAQALMISNGQRVRLYPTDNSKCLSLVVKDKDLCDVISLWAGHTKIPEIKFNKRLTMTNPGVISFLSYFHTIIDTLDRNSNLLRMPAAVASLENMLITFILFELGHNLGDFFTASCAEAGTNQIRDVEEYMEANCSKAINIKVLTQVTGHSARSIYRAFQKHRDYTPMEFLKHIRLRLARQKLMHGTSESMVTTVAYECGFTHLGRFSIEYKCCFGEKPSETLRQSVREKGLLSQEGNENR
jgi:AraC-like DNA-binding protein